MLATAIVSAQGPKGPRSPYIGSSVSGSDAYVKGLELWRQSDVSNSTCAFCHSPDALEIAAYSFDDDTLRRRAKPHLGEKGAEGIVEFIHAVREKYGIKKLLDPMKDRPLQPGGSVLPGKTPAERDLAFAKELETKLPTLASGNVDSLEAAEKAKDEVLAVDPRQLPVGIVFNRISEDGFHGREHATFAHWIADVAVQLKFPWPTYFIHENSYLENPNPQNLFAIVYSPEHKPGDPYAYDQMMAYDKFRALLVYSHVLRMEEHGEDAFKNVGPVFFGEIKRKDLPNPLLELGVFADARSDTPFSMFAFPDQILDKKLAGPTAAEQMAQIRLPSLYAGWLMDQGLERSHLCPEDRTTRIITERLLSDGPYPMHDAFLITRKLVVDGFIPEAWGRTTPQHFFIDYSAFLGDGNVKKHEPTDPEERAIYRRFVVNSFKMSLYLYEDGAAKDKAAVEGENPTEQIKAMKAYVADAEPNEALAFDALAAKVLP